MKNRDIKMICTSITVGYVLCFLTFLAVAESSKPILELLDKETKQCIEQHQYCNRAIQPSYKQQLSCENQFNYCLTSGVYKHGLVFVEDLRR